ncbi:MAG TPA: AraC family transcriptional regulator [Pyrinomonadaceae bacterium]|nr:AraC family transcriptional regulator [Pyrinomonadaceae bacterium]
MREESGSGQFGRMLAELRTPSFTVGEKSYPPGLRIPRHAHETVVMSFPLRGSFVESNSLTRYTCEPHGLSINPAGESHASDFCAEDARCLVVEVRRRDITLINESASALARPLYVRGAAHAALALRVQRELKAADAVSPLLVEGLMLEIVALAARDCAEEARGDAPRWLRRARDYLHAHFQEQVSLRHLAGVAGVHPAHLSRMFRRHYRRAVGDYVRGLRLDEGARELCDPEKTFAEIACALGFYDQSHFANAFKRHTGMTPAEFRREHARSSRPTPLRTSKTNPLAGN